MTLPIVHEVLQVALQAMALLDLAVIWWDAKEVNRSCIADGALEFALFTREVCAYP